MNFSSGNFHHEKVNFAKNFSLESQKTPTESKLCIYLSDNQAEHKILRSSVPVKPEQW